MGAEKFEVECVVVGAGVVGLACAAELARRGRDVLVLEAAGAIGTGTSSRNSEVIHAGLYYPTGSLKHRLCIEGRRQLYPYLQACGIAYKKCGKLIVAAAAPEENQIAALYRRALENEVENISLLTGEQATTLEANLSCVSALMSAETGIVDSHGYMLALLGELESLGGVLALNTPVRRARVLSTGGFALDTGGDVTATVVCHVLINAAGLHAHALASAMEGLDCRDLPPLVLAKGSYFGCAGKPAFSRLIYPAPVDGGLGVHLTLDLAGRMRFGPDVEWLAHNVPGQIDYSVTAERAASFYAAIRRYWPGLPDKALTPEYAGCRPKLSGAGEPAADFRVDGAETHGLPGLVNLFGIESPGLTASPALARLAADLALMN